MVGRRGAETGRHGQRPPVARTTGQRLARPSVCKHCTKRRTEHLGDRAPKVNGPAAGARLHGITFAQRRLFCDRVTKGRWSTRKNDVPGNLPAGAVSTYNPQIRRGIQESGLVVLRPARRRAPRRTRLGEPAMRSSLSYGPGTLPMATGVEMARWRKD